jgi:hypothetical protein
MSGSTNASAASAENFGDRFQAIISKINQHRMQINKMNRDVLELLKEANHDFGSARLETAVTENNALKEQINGLEGRIKELEEENEKLGNDYALLNKNHTNLQNDIRDAKEKNRKLEDDLAETEETLSQFIELSSRVVDTTISLKRLADDDRGAPGKNKRTRLVYETILKDLSRDDRSYEHSKPDTSMEPASRSEIRDSSPTTRPLSFAERRAQDGTYSNSGNAKAKVSDYLLHLPGSLGPLDDNLVDQSKTPLEEEEEINVRGKADAHHAEGVTKIREGSKVWLRTDSTYAGSNVTDSNGNGANGAGGGGHPDSLARQTGGPQSQAQNMSTPQTYTKPRRRIICHACWEVRARCDNHVTCGNCAAAGKECIRTMCVEHDVVGRCSRGVSCFKVHDERNYRTTTFSPFERRQ